jgi:hypothetical protein
VLKKASVPCLVVGDHLLKNALAMLQDKIVDFANDFYFFVTNQSGANTFSAYLIVPKKYAEQYASGGPFWGIDLSGLPMLASLGFVPRVLKRKKFSDIDVNNMRNYTALSHDEFGVKTVALIKNMLLDVSGRGRIVYMQGHGYSYLRRKTSEIGSIAVNLSLNSFVNLIGALEEKGTVFTHVLTCFMGGDNLSVLEKFMTDDLFNTAIAKLINVRPSAKKRYNKMFVSIASTADISTFGGVDVDLFFPAIDTLFGLLRSEAVKDVMPRLQDWLTRMFRTVGVSKDLVNYPQVRIPGNQTAFYLTDIHGDLQIINRFSTMQDRVLAARSGGLRDIHVVNKNVLVTYVDMVANKIVIEKKVPLILAMGSDNYFRSFKEIEVKVPAVDFFTFAYNSFYKDAFGDEMGHCETYLIEKISFQNEDIFEDIKLPREFQGHEIDALYNVHIKRGLDESAAGFFSLSQEPDADIFKMDEKRVVQKVEGNALTQMRDEIAAIREGQALSFDAHERQLVTNTNAFMKEHAANLGRVLPNTMRSFLIKSVIMGGRDCERILYLYLKLLEHENTRAIVEGLSEFIIEKYKDIPAWIRFEKFKMVILGFRTPSKQVVDSLNTLIEALFVFDNNSQNELKKYLARQQGALEEKSQQKDEKVAVQPQINAQ